MFESVLLKLFNTRVTPMTAPQLGAWLHALIPADKVTVVANHNLHSLYVAETNARFRQFYETADLILIDGFPVLLAASAAKVRRDGRGLSSAHRVGSLDWILDLGSISHLRRVALVGSAPESNRLAVAKMQAVQPNLIVRGWHGHSWDLERETAIVGELQSFEPDVILVALGMPLQELFIQRHREYLPAGVYATVGGAFDQVAGIQSAAPRWLGRFGLEWLWRFASQPRRLFHRYAIEPWKLAGMVISRKLREQLRK